MLQFSGCTEINVPRIFLPLLTNYMRSRRFCVTVNNPPAACRQEELFRPDLMEYLCVGSEVGDSGTPHFQIYLETTTKRFIVPLAKRLAKIWQCGQPHVEVAMGSAEQNKTYCSKDGIFLEFGTPLKQGVRTDLSDVIAAIASGSSMTELWQDHPEVMIKYGGGIRSCYQATSPNLHQEPLTKFTAGDYPSWPTPAIQIALESKTVILWGPSGTGKTCYARALLPTALFVSHMDDLLKFDRGTHDGIIFDDLSIAHLHREAQIHLVDMDQPRSIHCRYQVANIPAGTKKIFTTNNHEGAIYLVGDAAIERRIERFHCDTRVVEEAVVAPQAWLEMFPEGGEELQW